MDRLGLIQFICEMYNIEQCPDMILKQIYKYVTERRFSYLDIARALSYYVDVQGNEPQLKYGIGIVPCVMSEARKYFQKEKEKRDAQIAAAKKEKENPTVLSVIKVTIPTEKRIRKPQIDIDKL